MTLDASFMDDGLCRGAGADLWHPEKGDIASERAAKAVCRECPVREQCLDYALRNVETFGIWGGKSERQRRRLRVEMRRDGRLPRTNQPRPLRHGSSTNAYRRCREENGEACERCKAANALAKALVAERATQQATRIVPSGSVAS